MTEIKAYPITREIIDEALNYADYRELIDRLMASGKTTGENHSEAMLHYTKMNTFRMRRLDKTTELMPELQTTLEQIKRPMVWLVLTEAWCGDAAQIIPVLQKMADQNEMIELKLILRDQHLDIMDEFLTNGKSRSIPKLIVLDANTLDVLGDWGPRPFEAQEMYEDWRLNDGEDYREISETLHKWYADDKTESTQKELLPLLETWENA
ncbi:thioredoxin family protein [Rhodohalobacter halophilus]|uniref:thioredoxin family protein n=1 Tax=Rhodohalobacter halophilus TaxID=1812810 RepID=UPI00083FD3E9|nr:thioredoxin family protein [Rhodohalobacter halophilus]